jgi:hypothetical protein
VAGRFRVRPKGSQMPSSWPQRYLSALFAGLSALLVLALVLIGVLFVQLSQVRADIERVEGGVAFFGLQAQGMRASIEGMQPGMSARLGGAISELESFRSSTLEFTADVDQPVDIETEIVLDRDITIPVRTTLPIDQSFDTTIDVRGPLGVVVPVRVTVPLQLEVPIDHEVTVRLEETIPIEATVPVRARLPVAVLVADTELVTLADALIEMLLAIDELVTGLAR